MTSTTDLPRLRAAVQRHARPLTSLEGATDAELSVLDDVIGDARVVALGEGVHFVTEFGQAWRRLACYLAERHGFTVVAAEFGFHEARALNAWAHGQGSHADLATLPGTTNAGMDGVMARWLRQHNTTSAHPLQLVGLDTPVAGGDLALVLDALVEVVQVADPDALPLVQAAADTARRFTSPSRAGSAPLRAQLPAADLDHLSAILARLALRMDSLRSVYVARAGAERADLARRLLAVATTADADVAATQDALFGDGGLPLEGSLRDRLMADCLHWHLDRLPDSAKVVLLAHNSHVQKVPVSWPGYGLAALTLGSYLAEELGGEYRAVALTHQSRRVPEITPLLGAAEGFEVEEVDLDAPPADGVEALLEAAGAAGRPVVLQLAPVVADAGSTPSAIGSQSAWMPMDVSAAFDAVISVPTVTERTERLLR